MTLVGTISELNRELAMRRKVWQRLPGEKERFVNQDHQRQYDVLKNLLELLTISGETGWKEMEYRRAQKEQDEKAQQSLF